MAHARSGDAIAIGAYLGAGDVFDRSIVDFAGAYAEQNDLDHRATRRRDPLREGPGDERRLSLDRRLAPLASS